MTADANADRAVWLAQLRDMPLWIILSYLQDMGILSESYYRQDILPPGGPPDDYTPEQVPFESERRG